MSVASTQTEEQLSLWECLHDGILNEIASNDLARSMTITIDVPYLWEFHKLAEDTRFRLILEGAKTAVSLNFKPWPQKLEIPQGMPYEESRQLEIQHYAKGRQESQDWPTLVSKLNNAADFDVQNAFITSTIDGTPTLHLALTDWTDYPDVRITAEKIRYFIGNDRELTQHEFISFGEAYWKAWAAGSIN